MSPDKSTALLPGLKERERLLGFAGEHINEFIGKISELHVAPDVNARQIRNHLQGYDFDAPMRAADVLEDCCEMLTRWNLHVTHPRYFGLFNPSVAFMGIVADQLVAAFNTQAGVWHHSPIACEIEAHLIRYFCRLYGLPVDQSGGAFTSGGSEANQMGMLLALAGACPEFPRKGLRALNDRPVMYVSEESHHSFIKIAGLCGLGREAVRTVAVDKNLTMDLDSLQESVAADREKGFLPFLVVGTAGTTGAGVIDPLPEMAQFCSREGLHFHVDAAWGGAAIFSPAISKHLEGIEQADSITVDPHKWMSVPMGAGLFLCRDRSGLGSVFGVDTAYIPKSKEQFEEPFTHTPQWSRRFIGLKLFMSLAAAGRQGYASVIENQTGLGDKLRELLTLRGWRLANKTPLPLVCFHDPSLTDSQHQQLAADLTARGKVWISSTRIRETTVLRACVISYRTTESDLDILLDELDLVRQAIR